MESALANRMPLRLRRPARLLRLVGDERLVALVRGGDEGAFEALYDRHYPAILGFCRHMLGTREEAEDAVQHTFLAAFRDLLESEKAIDLRPWLFAIARNRCLSLLRARRTHVALELVEPATDGLAATVERREDLRELLADLACLPEDQRAALLLAELGALDHAGIAVVLDCPREKVKALVFQARTSLTASREARATPCEEIRVELATASGAALRRGPLRRHLRACDGCRAFKAEVAAQHKLMALALPVVPSVALKAGVIAGSSGGGGGASVSGALGAVTSTGAGKVALSLAAVSAVAGSGALTARLEQRDPAPVTAAAPLVDAPHTESGAPISTGELARHGAPLRLSAGRAPAVAPHQRRSPIVLRPVTAHAGSPGVVAPTPTPLATQAPAPTPSPAPTVNPVVTEPPALETTPPRHEHHRESGDTPPGQSQNPPGQSKAPPGQGATPPGHGKSSEHAKAPRSHSTTPPGQSQTPPGQSEAPPGQSKSPATPRSHDGDAGSGSSNGGGQSSQGSSGGGSSTGSSPTTPRAQPPGQSGGSSSPGQSGGSPGQSGGSHGQSGESHGQSGAAHGHAG
jgi:RNA polymerase sigma factor (sigma-70 family)